MTPLVCAFSAIHHVERRTLCRQTWFPGLRALGYKPNFILSAYPDDYDLDDCLILNCPSGYDALPAKTAALCRWANGRPLWKMDDDTLTIPSRLHAFTQSLAADYCGFNVGEWQNLHCGTKHGPYASGGGGYYISARSVAILADRLTEKTGAEDVLVGRHLAAAGVPLTHSPLFIPFGLHMGRPERDNAIISTHAITAPVWWDSWRQCS